MNYLPDRKVWATGLSGIAAWGILGILSHFNVNPPIDPTMLSAAIAWVVGWAVPPADRDIIKRLNNDLVKIAQDDPTIPVDPPRKP